MTARDTSPVNQIAILSVPANEVVRQRQKAEYNLKFERFRSRD